ncbi:hypothetical protein ACFQ7F_39495 [Streptomyces sp. NPDC056486]|uniref:hypothetical protein n=1 Tax=Streptomyces sp. NPDC056486 TaxID=3345835 RepID=UPI003673FF68
MKWKRLLSAYCAAPFARTCRLAGGRRPAWSTLTTARLLSVPRAYLDAAARTFAGDGGIAVGRDDEPRLELDRPCWLRARESITDAVPAAATPERHVPVEDARAVSSFTVLRSVRAAVRGEFRPAVHQNWSRP